MDKKPVATHEGLQEKHIAVKISAFPPTGLHRGNNVDAIDCLADSFNNIVVDGMRYAALEKLSGNFVAFGGAKPTIKGRHISS